jgi:hypothetical protein
MKKWFITLIIIFLLSSCSIYQTKGTEIDFTHPENILGKHINSTEIQDFIKSIDEEPIIYDEKEVFKPFEWFQNFNNEQENSSRGNSSNKDYLLLYTYQESGIELVFIDDYLRDIDIYLEKSEKEYANFQKFTGLLPSFIKNLNNNEVYYAPYQMVARKTGIGDEGEKELEQRGYVYYIPGIIYNVFTSEIIISELSAIDFTDKYEYVDMFLEKEYIEAISPQISEVNLVESEEENFMFLDLIDKKKEAITSVMLGIAKTGAWRTG